MEPTKRCPMCGELILRIAVRCKHCQADLRGMDPIDAAPPEPPHASYPSPPFHPGQMGMQHASPPFGFQNGPATAPQPSPATPPHPTIEQTNREYVAPTDGGFEQRFLDFAFKTSLPINPATVAYALKVSIDEATEGLDDLAVRDVLVRDVDARGIVNYSLPGRSAAAAGFGTPQHSVALSPYSQPPQLLYDPPGALNRAPTESTALAGLLVNVFFLPGVGSLIGGKTNAGVLQLLMFVLGLPLCLVVVGFPMMIGAWIWGLVSGVNMLAEAKNNAQQRRLAGG